MDCKIPGHAGVDGICCHCTKEERDRYRAALMELANGCIYGFSGRSALDICRDALRPNPKSETKS